jgi:hypothetical protein
MLGAMNLAQATALALDELRGTTIEQIHRSTAILWAGRSLASFQLYREHGGLQALTDGEDYMHEALEHAALSLDPTVLASIQPYLMQASSAARGSAMLAMGDHP